MRHHSRSSRQLQVSIGTRPCPSARHGAFACGQSWTRGHVEPFDAPEPCCARGCVPRVQRFGCLATADRKVRKDSLDIHIVLYNLVMAMHLPSHPYGATSTNTRDREPCWNSDRLNRARGQCSWSLRASLGGMQSCLVPGSLEDMKRHSFHRISSTCSMSDPLARCLFIRMGPVLTRMASCSCVFHRRFFLYHMPVSASGTCPGIYQ